MPPNNLDNNVPLNQDQPIMPSPPVTPAPVAYAPPVVAPEPTPTPTPAAADEPWAAPVTNPVPVAATEPWAVPVPTPMTAAPAQLWATPVTNPVPPFAAPQEAAANPAIAAGLSPKELKTITRAGLVAFIIGWLDLAAFVLLTLAALGTTLNRTTLVISALLMGVAGVTSVIFGHKLKKYNPMSDLNVKQTLIILTTVNLVIIAASYLTGGRAGLINIILMIYLGNALKVVSTSKSA